MSTFTLPDISPAVPVRLISNLSRDELMAFPAFKTWLSTVQHSLSLQSQESHPFHAAPYKLRSITIQSADFFGQGSRLGFLKFQAVVKNDNDETLPGSVFLRGGSVGMLLILTPCDNKDEKYVILTVQPRIPAGSLSFAEIPAGMLDDSGTFAGGAAKEIKEEVGLEIPEKELLNMTQLALEDNAPSAEEQLQKALYPSPGGSDEFIPLFLWEKSMPREQIEGFKGRLTGLRDRGEKITLKVVKLEDLWRVGARDGKTLAAFALYQGLKSAGKI
ncbi:putative nudix family [Phaeomoniella chlamydospora]|uniref:Putative nudix family n=1 Tax=Phaeomoniella chlamydospora TaxID=158046 RepID=A0A0G2G5Z3_PHACM|nr:putative nudix family [Phaeomoniella chlamydospora]